jgi:hypothetical protein
MILTRTSSDHHAGIRVGSQPPFTPGHSPCFLSETPSSAKVSPPYTLSNCHQYLFVQHSSALQGSSPSFLFRRFVSPFSNQYHAPSSFWISPASNKPRPMVGPLHPRYYGYALCIRLSMHFRDRQRPVGKFFKRPMRRKSWNMGEAKLSLCAGCSVM